jgi:3-deoxy-D-manno-octulosonic-acid transferase
MTVTGSVKFDPTFRSAPDTGGCLGFLSELGFQSAPRILLGASTHAGEEKLLAEIFSRLRREVPNLLLVLVPRHMERGASVESDIASLGLSTQRRTLPVKASLPDIVIVDSTGELPSWTAIAEVVFVGKSLLAKGGQNPAEAIALHRPVVFGPEMQNFSGLVRLILEKDGGRQVADATELEEVLGRLFAHPSLAAAMAERAYAALEVHTGATARSASILQSLVRSGN